MRYTCLALLSVVLCGQVFAATITGTFQGSDGSTNTVRVGFTPLTAPLRIGDELVVSGRTIWKTATNGILNTTLAEGLYRVLVGTSDRFAISVPPDAGPYPIGTVITDGITYIPPGTLLSTNAVYLLKEASQYLPNALLLTAGENVTLTPVGSNLEISAAGGGGALLDADNTWTGANTWEVGSVNRFKDESVFEYWAYFDTGLYAYDVAVTNALVGASGAAIIWNSGSYFYPPPLIDGAGATRVTNILSSEIEGDQIVRGNNTVNTFSAMSGTITNALNIEGTLDVGQMDAALLQAGNLQSDVPRKGDIWVDDGSNYIPLQVGQNGQVLTANSSEATGIEWAPVTLPTDAVRVGGQIGGTGTSPTVIGLRESGGPTSLTLGSIADGEYLLRSGSTVIGGTPAGGGAGTTASGSTSDAVPTSIYTHSVPADTTDALRAEVVGAGPTNMVWARVVAMLNNRTGLGSLTRTNESTINRSHLESANAPWVHWEPSGGDLVLKVTGTSVENYNWTASISRITQADAAAAGGGGGACDTARDSIAGTTAGTSSVGNQASTLWVASRLAITDSYSICRMDAPLAQVGSPSQNVTVALFSHDVGNNRPLSQLAASAPVAANTLPTTEVLTSFTMQAPAAVSSGTYWVVIKMTGIDVANYVTWYRISNTGTDNVMSSGDSGATWSSLSGTRLGKVTAYSN